MIHLLVTNSYNYGTLKTNDLSFIDVMIGVQQGEK